MMLNDSFFKKVEDKTKVNKDTIMSLAAKLQKSNLKDESVLRDVIKQLSQMSGKPVSKEQEDKIVKAVVNNEVPKNMDQIVNDKF